MRVLFFFLIFVCKFNRNSFQYGIKAVLFGDSGPHIHDGV